MNEGNGQFSFKELPIEAQLAPVHAIETVDYDSDGDFDLIPAGNFKAAETMGGWYDASLGYLIRNDGNGAFTCVKPGDSGLALKGNVKSLKKIKLAIGKQLIIAASSGEEIKLYQY